MNHVLTPAAKPNQITYTITGGVSTHDNGDSTGKDRKKVWARPGGKAVFNIENNDNTAYDVSIPFGEFAPKPGQGGPNSPIDEHATETHTKRIEKGRGVLEYVIKPAEHFPFSASSPSFTYKYTLRFTNLSTSRVTLVDPDLEVSP